MAKEKILLLGCKTPMRNAIANEFILLNHEIMIPELTDEHTLLVNNTLMHEATRFSAKEIETYSSDKDIVILTIQPISHKKDAFNDLIINYKNIILSLTKSHIIRAHLQFSVDSVKFNKYIL